jgi:DNA-binding NarL/FixJ family response regulator
VSSALARADDFDDPRWLAWAAVGAGATGEMGREVALLARAVVRARASGSIDALVLVLQSLSVEGIVAGRHDVTAEASEGLRLARETGLPNAAAVFEAVLAWFAAVRGEDASCVAHAAGAVERARGNGLGLVNALAEWSLGLLALGRGRADEALLRLEALAAAPPGAGHPYVALVSAPDLVEAAVRAAREDAARRAALTVEAFAPAGGPPWALALAARCRGLLPGGADDDFAEALDLHAEGTRPFDRARTELLYGESLRRQRRRVEARAHLRAALEAFESIGAAPWAERARSELRASGETARRRDPSTVAQLTPQERQVAGFVADGLSNKEVAAQLFLSPRTIDAHLRNVFAKLGVTSRTQLASLLARGTLPA